MYSLIVLLSIIGSSQAFSIPNVHTQRYSTVSSKQNGLLNQSMLRMSTVDDEVAALRAAAQKAREEAQKLAKVRIPYSLQQNEYILYSNMNKSR